jgi:FkbM family methyltransferase
VGLRRNLRRWYSDFKKVYIEKDKVRIGQIRWKKDRGDETLRYDLPISECRTVFDVGGYMGGYTAEIRKRYDSECYLFEPVPLFYEECSRRFDGDAKVHCYPFGLSGKDETLEISLLEDASSTLLASGDEKTQEVEIRGIVDFLAASNVDQIDLMKINIEGGEFGLLEALTQSEWIDKVNVLQIQFHDFVDNADAMRDSLRIALAKTHKELWNYDFVWECWMRKSQ